MRFENQKPPLRYKRARFYSAQLGRFISRDPLGFVDGMSLYRAYFVPGKVDPSGMHLTDTNKKDDSGRSVFLDRHSKKCYVKDDVNGTTLPHYPNQGKFTEVPCPPDRPIDPDEDPTTYDCWGLAFRIYEFGPAVNEDFQPLTDALKKRGCKSCKNGCCPDGQLQCTLWLFDLDISFKNPNAKNQKKKGYHIVCGLNNHPPVSKNGPGPISGPGPASCFKPTKEIANVPDIVKDFTMTIVGTQCVCCPDNGGAGK